MKNTNIYAGYRYPPQIISHAVWLYHRFTLSFRDIEELLAARGITVSYETVRNWCNKFGQRYCSQIRKNRGQLVDTWYLDEVFIKIDGAVHYLWRAVEQDGNELDIIVQKRKNNCCELSHQLGRQQEWQMRRFKYKGRLNGFIVSWHC